MLLKTFFLAHKQLVPRRQRTSLVYSTLNAFKTLESATWPPVTSTPCLQILRVLVLREQEFLGLGGLHKHI